MSSIRSGFLLTPAGLAFGGSSIAEPAMDFLPPPRRRESRGRSRLSTVVD